MHGRGVVYDGGTCVAGGVHGEGVYVAGVCVWQGGMDGEGHGWWGACVVGGMHGGGHRGRRDHHCSGRYASYWNAVLF